MRDGGAVLAHRVPVPVVADRDVQPAVDTHGDAVRRADLEGR